MNHSQPIRGCHLRACLTLAFALSLFSGGGLCDGFRIEALSFGPKAINNRGEILSNATFVDGRWRVRVLDRGTLRELPLPEQLYEVMLHALNDVGWVVGVSRQVSGPNFVAMLFTDSVAIVLDEAIRREIAYLATPPEHFGDLSWVCSWAVALNNSGQIVGDYCAAKPGEVRAYVRDTSGTRDLGSLGGEQTHATAINNRGHITGWSETAGGTAHMFLVDADGLRDLGSLGGETIHPVAINDRGEIAGSGDTLTGGMHVFLYSNGSLTDLGCPKGGRCMATAMNSEGHIVGSETVDLEDGSTRDRGFLYADGRFLYLDDLVSNGQGWSGLDPVGINDAGQIVGVGSFAGMGTGYVLEPLQ